MHEKRPNIKQILVFRSTCYILRDRTKKFEAKSDLGIFIGYSNSSCTYQDYNFRFSTIMESINIMINESSAT